TLAAIISRIHPALGKNLLGSVEMVMPASPFGLPSGSTVAVDLVGKVVTGAIIPENALIKSTVGSLVCVIQGGVVQVRKVAVLGTAGGKAAVAGELTVGAKVVVGQENRLLTLADGSPVQVEGGAE
ncbi:MAG: hypothetical protein IT369_21580, partial [Candidatus Latescibacteria bacterium]|nr:hypothetical protein [Candidatus Latescibacterota bacterium]